MLKPSQKPTRVSAAPRVRSVAWRTWAITALFLGIIGEILWTAFWLRGRPPEDTAPVWDALYRRQATRFRESAERLGGLLIKVGQFLSSRVDLLPKPFIDELQKLQDNVAAAPWEEIRPHLEAELGPLAERFVVFQTTPLAAASLGQVYEAVLADGPRVAVKIQRPHIAQIVTADLKALYWVVTAVSRLTSFGRTFDLYTVLKEFRRTVFEELDYHRELSNTEKIRDLIRDVPYVHVPLTYPQYSTGRVLVMEFCHGIKVNQRQALIAAGINPTLVAEKVIRLYLHMVMDLGVYHADPHPGNILVADDGTLVLLDYGMVGALDLAARRQIRRLFVAVSERNPSQLVASLNALGMVRPLANQSKLRRQVGYLLDRYYAETLSQLADLDIANLLRDFEELLRDEAIQVPGHFAFLGRAIAILVGLAMSLDPNINLVALFTPYARRFVTEDAGGLPGYALSRIQNWGKTVVELPVLTTHLLRQAEAGELQTRVEWAQGDRDLKDVRAAIRHLTYSLYVVGFAIVGAWMFASGHYLARDFFFGLSGFAFMLNLARRRRP